MSRAQCPCISPTHAGQQCLIAVDRMAKWLPPRLHHTPPLPRPQLKRWVERGKENVADAALAPPPKVLGSALSQPAAAR